MGPTGAAGAPPAAAVSGDPGPSPTSPEPVGTSGGRGRAQLEWLGLALLVLLQLRLFTRYIRTYVSPFYPVNHDQLPVLEWAYRGARVARAHLLELPSVFVSPESLPHAQFFRGALLPLLAMASSSVLGVDRLSAALVNFAALAVGECAIYWYLRRRGGAPSGVLGMGLFLLAGTHYYWVGGLNDLRRDYLGVLAMGVSQGAKGPPQVGVQHEAGQGEQRGQQAHPRQRKAQDQQRHDLGPPHHHVVEGVHSHARQPGHVLG